MCQLHQASRCLDLSAPCEKPHNRKPCPREAGRTLGPPLAAPTPALGGATHPSMTLLLVPGLALVSTAASTTSHTPRGRLSSCSNQPPAPAAEAPAAAEGLHHLCIVHCPAQLLHAHTPLALRKDATVWPKPICQHGPPSATPCRCCCWPMPSSAGGTS